jgi:hypothetical protein
MMKTRNEIKKKAIRTLAEMKCDYWMGGCNCVEANMLPYIEGAAIGLDMDPKELSAAVKKEFKLVLREARAPYDSSDPRLA